MKKIYGFISQKVDWAIIIIMTSVVYLVRVQWSILSGC